MLDENFLKKEMSKWIQEKLEQNKFPCATCKHFEPAHVKGLCIACHEVEDDIHRNDGVNCFHKFKQIDNLSLIEWVAENKNQLEK